MTLFQALVLGVLQGISEFLPISSSGHLALAEHWLAIDTPGLLFDVVVHLGTLAAIALLLRGRIAALARAGLSLLAGRAASESQKVDRSWVLLIAAASLPTAIIGLLLKDSVESAHARPAAVGAGLLVTAVLLVAAERRGRRDRGAGLLGLKDALLIGVAQGLAVFPGISRSGATIAAALGRDVRGDTAVEFSMLISIPAVAGAALLEIVGNAPGLSTDAFAPLAVGFGTALLTGVFALKALQWAVSRRRLLPFAVYCSGLGMGAIFLG